MHNNIRLVIIVIINVSIFELGSSMLIICVQFELISAVSPQSPFPYIHTTLYSHDIPGSHTHSHPRWNDNRFSGSTIMYNFATALLMARRKYGVRQKIKCRIMRNNSFLNLMVMIEMVKICVFLFFVYF